MAFHDRIDYIRGMGESKQANQTAQAVPLALSQVLRRARRPDLSSRERADVWRLAAECAVKYVTSVVLSLLEAIDVESARTERDSWLTLPPLAYGRTSSVARKVTSGATT